MNAVILERHLLRDRYGNPVLDTYGYPVDTSRERHPRCTCKVPCQKRFRCRSRRHRGNRSTPWCNGCDDDMAQSCDACWHAAHATQNTGRVQLWDQYGTPLQRNSDIPCPKCGEDGEVGSCFDWAWCCLCGWYGSYTELMSRPRQPHAEAERGSDNEGKS